MPCAWERVFFEAIIDSWMADDRFRGRGELFFSLRSLGWLRQRNGEHRGWQE